MFKEIDSTFNKLDEFVDIYFKWKLECSMDEKLKPLVDYVFEKTKMPDPFLSNTLRNVLNDILEGIDYDA